MNKVSLIGMVTGIVAAVVAVVVAVVVPRLELSSIPVPEARPDLSKAGPTPARVPELAKIDFSHLDINAFLKFEGRFEASGAGGSWVLEGICHSGELDGFFGVRLTTTHDDGLQVKVVKDPVKGWAVIANEPDGCKSTSTGKCFARIFEAADCSTFAIHLTVERQQRTQFLDGTISIDCTYRGAHLVGKATINGCGPEASQSRVTSVIPLIRAIGGDTRLPHRGRKL